MIIDELARDMGFNDYDDMVAETGVPFVLAQLEILLGEEGS